MTAQGLGRMLESMAPILRLGPAMTLVAALVALAACGGGDGENGTASPTPTGSGTPTPVPDEPAGLEGITAAHNEVRAGVGVGPMTWSPSLAATAQSWAEACVDVDAPAGLIDHNDGRSDGHPYYVGENIYGSGGGATGIAAVQAWAAEVSSYDYDTNACTGVCGHYTQIVWATSVDLGCGIATCPGLTYGNGIVCDYGPGGNSGGKPY